MPDMPRHPDTPEGGTVPDDRPAPNRPWRAYAVGIIAVALVALVVVLHLTGVLGPGSHK